MRRCLTAVILTIGILLSCHAKADESLLQQLDRLIADRADFDRERSLEITRNRLEYDTATTDASRYNALRGLYEKYRSFRIDSAIIIADKRLQVARRLGTPSKIASATINLAEGYARAGDADRAIAVLDTLKDSSLEDYHRKYRSSVYRSAYQKKSSSALLARDRIEAIDSLRKFRDDAASEVSASSRGSYTLEAERLRDAGLYAEAVAKMEEANSIFDFSNDAALLFTMGDIYYSAGQRDKAIDFLTCSAMLDITNGTKEYKSLILLASILYEEGQLHRAFDYINCAFEDANFSNSNLRTAEIMKSMPVIDKAFHEAQKNDSIRTQKFLIFASFLVILLLISLIFAIIAFRDKRKMIATVNKINAKLEEQNAELVRADSLKLHHINLLLLAYSAYISRLKDFRKTILRLLKTSQFDKAVDALKADKTEIRDIAAFHEMFDEAFLSMFPDFIDEINRYFISPVKLKSPGHLTAELRVAAMMKIGLSSTDEFVNMLHYSPQTVYNLRSSLKSMLNVTWEEFERLIKN